MKLIVSDMDGTLVPDGSPVIDPACIDIMKRVRDRGHIFVVASGRQYHSIENVLSEVARTGDFYAIAEGGALIFKNGTLLSKEVIAPKLVDEMLLDIRRLKEKGCDVMVSSVSQAYCPHKDSELYRWMTGSYRYEIEATGGFDRLPREDVLKISIYHPFDCEGVCREWFYQKWHDRMMLCSAGDWWVDCTLPSSTKGASLVKLQKLLGIDREDTICFGDNINDIPMFEAAGISCAVGNARDLTKQAADRVIGSYKELGVLKELERMMAAGEL